MEMVYKLTASTNSFHWQWLNPLIVNDVVNEHNVFSEQHQMRRLTRWKQHSIASDINALNSHCRYIDSVFLHNPVSLTNIVVKIKDYRNILAGNSKLLDSPQQETHTSQLWKVTTQHRTTYMASSLLPIIACRMQRAPIIVTEILSVCLSVTLWLLHQQLLNLSLKFFR